MLLLFWTRRALWICLISLFAAALPASAQIIPQTDTAETTRADAVQSLLDVLKDDAARAALIAELEAARVPDTLDTTDPAPEVEPTLARRLAETTSTVAQKTVAAIVGITNDISGVGRLMSSLSDERRARIAAAWLPLALTIASTVALLWGLTRTVGRVLNSHRAAETRQSWRSMIMGAVVNAVVDAVVLLVAYAAGYAFSITLFGSGGALLVEQSLYLNAFLVAGTVRIIARVFLLPDHPDQALSNLQPDTQRVAYRRVKVLNFLLVYGLTAAVPIANGWFSLPVGRSLRVTIVTLAAVIALFAIRRLSRLVNAHAQMRAAFVADDLGTHAAQGATTWWNRIWPWLAAAYVIAVFALAISQPRMMVDLVGAATLKTLGAMLLGTFGARLWAKAATVDMQVGSALDSSFPELQARLGAIMPTALRILAAGATIGAIAVFLDAWGILDIGGWLSSATGSALVWRIISALLIILTVVMLWAAISSWIDHRLRSDLQGSISNARSRTLLALFRNAFTIAIFIFGTMIALSQLGIDIAPLLAGAGVIGLAIGFGSQKLVQDIITGVFIQLENAFNEGDMITVGGTSGTVEKLTIRSVGLRDLDGVYHIVPFSSVDTVSNYMRKFSYHVAVIGVAYKEKLPAVKEAMGEAFERLKLVDEGAILDDLEMHGVIGLGDSSVNLRARFKTLPGLQFELGRVYTELLKEVMDERGIEIPFPHRQVIMQGPPAAQDQ